MDNSVLVVTNDTVNVRDSWDVLETPRMADSDSDDSVTRESPDNIYELLPTCDRNLKTVKTEEHTSQQHLRKLVTQSREVSSRQKTNRRQGYIKCDSSERDSRRSNKVVRTGNAVAPRYGTRFETESTRPTSTEIYKDNLEKSKIIPRRYRRLGLRTHDEMLQEQFDQLRHLLRDSENMSREELTDHHVEQTRNIIANEWGDTGRSRPHHKYYDGFKAMSGGAKTRGIVISRSLPESLRPKSPRSSSSSSIPSPRGAVSSSYNSSRTPSPQSKKCGKKVSFKNASSKIEESQQHRRSRASPTFKEISAEKKLSNSQIWSSESDTDENIKEGQSRTTSDTGSCSDSLDEADNKFSRDKKEQVEYCDRGDFVEKEISRRIKSTKPKGKHQYLSQKQQIATERQESQESSKFNPKLSANNKQEEQRNYGVIETSNGLKKSDSNLRRTANPDIRQWLKEKERNVRRMKKSQIQKEEQEKAAQELEAKRKLERKIESEKQLKQWKASKRKQARLLRRQNIATRKLVTQQMSASESDLANIHTKSKESVPQISTKQPTAPTNPRPKSAPATRHRNLKPQQVPLKEVIQNHPDLREKLKQLEKQKRLKHRQSYDDWLKIKEKEKRETLKIIRERRLKLEKEIGEETAKVISEAAKRRIDNVRADQMHIIIGHWLATVNARRTDLNIGSRVPHKPKRTTNHLKIKHLHKPKHQDNTRTPGKRKEIVKINQIPEQRELLRRQLLGPPLCPQQIDSSQQGKEQVVELK